MSFLRFEVRPGAYADSIVLMQLQGALAAEPGVEDAGAVMATAANLELLAANELRPEELAEPRPNDLVVAVRAESAEAAEHALGRIDDLLNRRRGAEQNGGDAAERRPRSLAAAARALGEAEWVLVSVPGRHAAGVAGEALDLGKHVFLYSDNVSLADEVALKQRARDAGRLVMGPDCGTAIVGGIGFGFANRVRRGPIGLVGASGTGLQAVASRIHALGGGVSQALGTGGRDVSGDVGGITALQCLDLLARDTRTRVIVLVAKPPAPAVTADLLAAAREAGKPVVVWFLGAPAQRDEGTGGVGEGGVLYAADAEAAAWRAVDLTRHVPLPVESHARGGESESVAPSRAEGDLRALLVGGTLAYEAQIALRTLLHPIHSNVPLLDSLPIDATGPSEGHTILDLGADELTVGRPHPMIDQDLRLRRMRQEAADPKTGVLLLDVVLGYGAHRDPAAELAPAIAEILETRPELAIVVGMVGTDGDPQDLASQVERLREAGATVCADFAAALHEVRLLLAVPTPTLAVPVALEVLDQAPAAINVGVELFYDGLVEQGARAIQVDWRPPAGGDERLQSLLAKMRG